MENKTLYKDTQVGVIPADWDMKMLGELSVGKGAYGIGASAVGYSEKLPRYLRITDISEEGKLINDDPKCVEDVEYFRYVLKENDIVFARTGNTTGKTYIYSPKDGLLVYAGFLIKFSINHEIANARFVKFFTETSFYWHWVRIMSVRSGQPGINESEYAKLLIPLPPLKEQQKIASILSTWDKAIELKEKLIEQKKEQKEGLMLKLLTGEIRLPGFDGEWDKLPFDEIFIRIPVKKYQIKTKEYVEIGKYPVVDQGQKRIVAYSNDDAKVFSVQKEGVIVFGDHTRELKFIDFNFIVGADGTQVLNAKDGFNNKFYYYHLLIQNIPNTGYNRHFKFLKEMWFYKPSEKEQGAIADILSTADKEVQILNKKVNALKEQKKGLMQLLLTGKIRLKV